MNNTQYTEKNDAVRRDYVISAILVQEDVLPSVLLQTMLDYKEDQFAVGEFRIQNLKTVFHTTFPDLVVSDEYRGKYKGVILSKRDYNNQPVDMNEVDGTICNGSTSGIYNGFLPSYKVRVYIVYDGGKEFTDIMVNHCFDTKTLPKYNRFAKSALRILQKPKYVDMLGFKAETAHVEMTEIHTAMSVLVKLAGVSKKDDTLILSAAERTLITQELYKWVNESDIIANININYKNRKHRGFIMGFLVYANGYNADRDGFVPTNLPIDLYAKYRAHCRLRGKWMVFLLSKMSKTSTQPPNPMPETKCADICKTLLKFATAIAENKPYDIDAIGDALKKVCGEKTRTWLTTEYQPKDDVFVGWLVFILLDAALSDYIPYYSHSLINPTPDTLYSIGNPERNYGWLMMGAMYIKELANKPEHKNKTIGGGGGGKRRARRTVRARW